ncbi:hypothetical protein ACFL04_04210 [Patescibacteria group bacterium]
MFSIFDKLILRIKTLFDLSKKNTQIQKNIINQKHINGSPINIQNPNINVGIDPPTLESFTKRLSDSNWSEKYIGNDKKWICDNDAAYEITIGESEGEFDEEWTKGHPDPIVRKYPVYLLINGSKKEELIFISLDGGRYFIPLPEKKVIDEKSLPIYYYDHNSIIFKVASIIGDYYRYPNIIKFASSKKIEIT